MVGELHSRPHPLTVAIFGLFPLLLIRQSPDLAVGGLRVALRSAEVNLTEIPQCVNAS